jgi:hypothetical protein
MMIVETGIAIEQAKVEQTVLIMVSWETPLHVRVMTIVPWIVIATKSLMSVHYVLMQPR